MRLTATFLCLARGCVGNCLWQIARKPHAPSPEILVIGKLRDGKDGRNGFEKRTAK